MGKKKNSTVVNGNQIPTKSPSKINDRWSSIENGEAKSAAVFNYKEPSKDPKFVHPAKLAKPKKMFDGLDIEERVLSHGPIEGKGSKKRKNRENSVKSNAKKQRIDVKRTDIVLSKQQNKHSAVTTSAITKSTYFVEEPDNDEVTLISNGRETKFKKTVVVESDDEHLIGLESDEEFEDEELEDEEFEDEEIEDEDETDIDENEMVIDPKDIERYIDFESVEDEEGFEDEEEIDDEEEEDEDEEEEEEDVGDEESVVSDMDADSDDEGFIAGKHRETHVISKDKSVHSSNLKVIDFDKFPFTDDDSVVTASRAFGFLISPCDVQTFFDKFYQSNVLVVHRKQSNYFGNLFSTDRLAQLLEKNHLEYGNNINIAQYKNGIRTTLNGNGRAYPQIVKQHLRNLCSVQLVNPQTFDDRIWYLCEVLQEQFGCFVGANTYLTPAGSSGFAPHWDEIDAFLLQVEGRKYWRVWAPETVEDELPIESSDNFTEDDMKGREPVFEGWIEKGDMIYIPRGFIHQARTDSKVHSLHVTVSTGRQWSFANLMEKVIPEAVGALTQTRHKLRRGLPIGLFDMGGVVDLDYPQEDHFVEKFKIVVDRHMSMLRNLVADHLLDSSVDSLAKEFMKQALPPILTEKEKKLSVIGSSTDLLGDDLVDFNAKTKVRLIRKHTQRLLMESEDSCFISHRMNNSRLFEGRPESIIDFPSTGIDTYRVLSNAYPEWKTLDEIFSSRETRTNTRKEKLESIQLLFQIGVLLVKN
uniref:Bifunctional lysine-specific demethylase and histidyl-hydroxylase n=1 Tax=Caenorhabditis tropicalis TaxID=1561998 RepID=A0A1I7TKC0_9PELO